VSYPIFLQNVIDEKALAGFNNKMQEYIDTKQKVDIRVAETRKMQEGFKDFLLDKNIGRIRYNLEHSEIPEDMLNAIKEVGRSINPNATLDIISFVRYSKRYGIPQLVPHYDKPSHVAFLIDLQVNSNMDWQICVEEDKNYVLKNNEALVLDATRQIHWRKPIVFEDDQFLDVMFFTFNDTNIDMACIIGQEDRVKKYYDPYKEEADALYPDYMQQAYKRVFKMW
jgi:hypothetical protein